MAVILIVDDDVSHRAKLDQIISKKLEHETIVFDNGQKVVDYMLWRQEPIPDIILLDLFMPGMDGLEVIQNLQQTHPDLPIIALTMSGAVNRSTEAIAAGAYDYVPKPVTTERLHLAIQHALEVRNLRKDVSQWKPLSTFSLSLSDYAGYSDSYAQAIAKAQQAANNDMTVIIEGEAGVGKSCMARAIHNNSDRCNTPFITLDTTQDLDSLQMYIDKAEGGTIMANHRDHAPEGFFNAMETLYEYVFKRDTRIIICHHIHSRAQPNEVMERFLSRMRPETIYIPSLRERRQDVIRLAEEWLSYVCRIQSLGSKSFSKQAKDLLYNYDWPGNARELRREVLDAASSSIKDVIQADELQLGASGRDAQNRGGHIALLDDDGGLRSLQDIESEIIQYALHEYTGSRSDVARRLGIGRTTLYRKAQLLDSSN